jgi:enamine deaminase RidA (YjgF/YER057c/UK114 family)
MSRVEDRLKALGITLPVPAAPVANYIPFVIVGDLAFVSGQIPNGPDGLIKGKLGGELSVEAGQAAAKLCGVSLLAQIKAACGGDLDRVKQVVKLGGFVNATPDFVDIPKVINGCSDLMVAAFGDAGKHARSAVACPTLPLGAAVEVDAVVQLSA